MVAPVTHKAFEFDQKFANYPFGNCKVSAALVYLVYNYFPLRMLSSF